MVAPAASRRCGLLSRRVRSSASWRLGMECPRCRQENPPQARFCLECATPLTVRCASCGIQLPGGAKFCFECATPVAGAFATPRFASPAAYTPKHLADRILATRGAVEGERKQVTVLFCDLCDSMPLAQHLGDEGMHGLLN